MRSGSVQAEIGVQCEIIEWIRTKIVLADLGQEGGQRVDSRMNLVENRFCRGLVKG